jgi:hypothetical protein
VQGVALFEHVSQAPPNRVFRLLGGRSGDAIPRGPGAPLRLADLTRMQVLGVSAVVTSVADLLEVTL